MVDSDFVDPQKPKYHHGSVTSSAIIITIITIITSSAHIMLYIIYHRSTGQHK